jgi:hypothetical protein
MSAILTSLGRETPFQICHLAKTNRLLVVYTDGASLYESENGALQLEKELVLPCQAAAVLEPSGGGVLLAGSDLIQRFDSSLVPLSSVPAASEEEVMALLPVGVNSFLAVTETQQVACWSSATVTPSMVGQWMVECLPLFAKQNGKTVICAERGRLQERDPKTGTVLRTWPKSASMVWGTNDLHDQHALLISEEGTASIWDLSSREFLFDFTVDFAAARAVFHPSGLRGVLLGLDGEIAEFRITEGGKTDAVSSTESPIVALTYGTDSLLGVDENGQIWSWSQAEPVCLGGQWAGWATCSYSPNPDRILLGTASGSIETFTPTGQQIGSAIGLHKDAVVALLPWQEDAISVGADASILRLSGLSSDQLKAEVLAEFPGRMVVDQCACVESGTLWVALDEGLIAWLSLTDPTDNGQFQLQDRRVEEIRVSGPDSIVALTDRGSVRRMQRER